MRRPFAVSDHGLWDDVRRTITPLGRRAKKQPPAPAVAAAAPISPQLYAAPKPDLRRERTDAPPLAGFDRRTAQRLSRGQLEPEARIDLHGESLELARMKLYHFLEGRRRDGVRLVLVITGKGASPFARHTLHGVSHYQSPEREGRLRRELPHWLAEEIFRTHVVGFQPAHPRHGGGGAFYLRLRQVKP